MKNNIDSNFAIAILALVAACVGFALWSNYYLHTISISNPIQFTAKESTVHIDVGAYEVNKLLREAGEDSITFPDECNYIERSFAEGVSVGFEFSYLSSVGCPYFSVVSKDIVYSKVPLEFGGGYVQRESYDHTSIKTRTPMGPEYIDWLNHKTFQRTYFTSAQCSPSIGTEIVHIFPEGSILDFAIYGPQAGYSFSSEDLKDVCEPQGDVIAAEIERIRPRDNTRSLEISTEQIHFFDKMFNVSNVDLSEEGGDIETKGSQLRDNSSGWK